MTGMFLVIALSCVPLVLVIALIVRKAWVHHRRVQRRPTAPVAPSSSYPDVAVAKVGAKANVTDRAIYGSREVRSQSPSAPARGPRFRNYIAPGDFIRAAFDYTIRRQPAGVPKRVMNQGGFAEVPIVLHDRRGTSFLTHRKICLN